MAGGHRFNGDTRKDKEELKTQQAEEIADALTERVVAVFGPPGELISDQGAAFTSNLVTKVLGKLQTQQTLLFSHTARANGQNERSHAWIMASLRIMTQAYAENWVRVLPYIQLVYNTTPRSGSSLSAYDVVFARQPRMPRSALLPPRTSVAGNAPEDLFEINVQQVATSLREAWSALRRANLEKAEAERLPVPVTFAKGDQVLVLYSASAKRRNKHYMASEGPCTVTKINGNDYEVRNNATNNVKSVHWSVLHRVYDRRRSQSSGAGRGTTDAEDVPINDAPGARDATDAQGQQPGKPKKAVKGQVAPSARPKTAKGKKRERDIARALGPDVVDDKGQRVPFSRRGGDSQSSSSDDDNTKTTGPRASRPAKPGLPMPLTIEEYSYVIVDNGAANPGELAIGRVHKVDDELVDVHWHALKDASVPTPMQVWQPTWVGADGTLRTSDLPPRGRTAETYEVSRRRVLYAFKDLDQGRLPAEAQAFLARI
jgi:hypothetical protein